MPFYRGYYLNITDFDVTSVSAKKVKSNDGREVLVAKTALTSKSVVCHIANPLLVALDSVELKKRCYTCYHPRNELLALQLSRADDGRYDDLVLCEGCEVVSFCSSACKQLGSEFHGPECRVFQRLAPKVPPSNLRGVLRLLLRKGGYWPLLAERHWEDLIKCNGHVDRFRTAGGKRWEDLVTLTQCAMEYSNTKEDFVTVLNIFCLLLMYRVPLQTRQFETIGIAMHPWMTNISHSCEPNSIVNFDHVSRCGGDHRLRINPLRNIARDEKITIEYLDGSIPLSLRTKELRSNYFFECKCANCVRESVHGLGHLLPEQLSTLERVRDLVGAAETDTTRRMPVQRLRYALHLLLSCSWAPEHYPFCFILRKLVSAYVADEQYNLAFAHSLVLRRAAKSLYKKRPGRSHPMALADLYVMLRLMDKIIGAQGWASQELDLASRKLNLVGLRRLWADKLCSLSSNVYSWSLPRFDGSRYIEGIRRLDFSAGNALRDPEKKRECMEPLNELADEMWETLRRW